MFGDVLMRCVLLNLAPGMRGYLPYRDTHGWSQWCPLSTGFTVTRRRDFESLPLSHLQIHVKNNNKKKHYKNLILRFFNSGSLKYKQQKLTCDTFFQLIFYLYVFSHVWSEFACCTALSHSAHTGTCVALHASSFCAAAVIRL